jgi:hypothetical protein
MRLIRVLRVVKLAKFSEGFTVCGSRCQTDVCFSRLSGTLLMLPLAFLSLS